MSLNSRSLFYEMGILGLEREDMRYHNLIDYTHADARYKHGAFIKRLLK